MKVSIDFSIFITEKAYGNIEGEMEFLTPPSTGDMISFMPIKSKVEYPNISGFFAELEVKQRVFIAGKDKKILVLLDDVVLTSMDDAEVLSNYLALEYDLYLNKY